MEVKKIFHFEIVLHIIKKSDTIKQRVHQTPQLDILQRLSVMKNILLLLLMTSLSLFALGQEIHDFKYETSYYSALKKAKDNNKVLLLMMAKKGCPNCAYMKDIVFERKEILDFVNANYIVAVLDVNHRNYPKRFISPRAPTFFFLDPHDGRELREHKVGGSRPWKFIQELTEVKDAFDNNTTVTLKQKKKKVEDTTLTSVIKIIEEPETSTIITH
jgi:thiol-disulfide isomerase/thioredoxin